jgi:hypothetical protein
VTVTVTLFDHRLDSNPWAHLALGWVAFLKRHTDDAVVEYSGHPTSNFAAAHGHLWLTLAFDGQSDRGILNSLDRGV